MRKSQEREMYKVSFIVPLYNGRKYIEGLVSAIQKIDYSNIELIFIDDGSTDKSKELYDTQYRDMEDIYYIYQSNGGIANARNVGVDNANGDYLIFLDQDDSINPQNMTKAILRAVEDNVDILLYTTERKKGNITWGCDVVYDDIKVIDKKEISKILKSIIFREENSYADNLRPVHGFPVHGRTFLRRGFLLSRAFCRSFYYDIRRRPDSSRIQTPSLRADACGMRRRISFLAFLKMERPPDRYKRLP